MTVDMERDINMSITEFEEENPGFALKQVATPAAENLFNIRAEGGEKLPPKEASIFHAIVTILLFVVK